MARKNARTSSVRSFREREGCIANACLGFRFRGLGLGVVPWERKRKRYVIWRCDKEVHKQKLEDSRGESCGSCKDGCCCFYIRDY